MNIWFFAGRAWLSAALNVQCYIFICIYIYIYVCVCVWVCVCVGMLPPCCSDGQQAHCLWCCAVYIGELQLVDLSLLHCVLNSIVSSVHQCATSACVRLWPGPSWRICDWRVLVVVGANLTKRRTCEEGEDEGRKRDQNLSVLSDWVVLDSTVSTFHKELQESREGGRGDLLMYTVPVLERVCVFVCVYAHVTHSNHLNYFL